MKKKTKKKVVKKTVKRKAAKRPACKTAAKKAAGRKTTRKTSKKTVKKTAKKKGGKKPANKGGNKTDYKAEYARIACEFARDGNFSARKLAEKFGVCPQTIINWKNEHQEFGEAIEVGIDIAVDDVEEAYFRLAKGGIEQVKTQIEIDSVKVEGAGDEAGDEAGDVKTRKTLKNTKVTKSETLPHERAANRILAAHRAKYRDQVDGNIKVDGLSQLLEQIDGSGKDLPSQG